MASAGDSTGTHVASILIIVCGYATNGFICAAFILCHRLQTTTNYFVVNMALSGIVSFLVITMWEFLSLLSDDDRSPNIYLFAQSLDIFAACLSAASVTAIAFDRYFAVSRPLRYNTCVTHKKAMLAIAAVWAYATLIALMTWFRILDDEKWTFAAVYSFILTLYNFFVALVLCLYCYISILLIAWPHLRQNDALQHYAPNSRGFALAKHLKITFTILVLSAPVIFGWCPYYVITIVEHFQLINAVGIQEYIISMLPNIIAALNPIIYVCLTKDFRGVAAMWICCRRRKRASNQSRFTATVQTFPPLSAAVSITAIPEAEGARIRELRIV